MVHAAALKQVPACEYNPMEAVKTNILGSSNVIDAALDASVETCTLRSAPTRPSIPSTCTAPPSWRRKRLFVQSNAYAGGRTTRFSCVRYGNVVGSRGSVVPVFLKQRESGKVTITDDRMTRFWISLEQGVRFVIRCIEDMHGGEVFVPKIPSMKVVDLSKAVAPEAEVEVIGIRPGEKLHEVLISEDEARTAVELEDMYVVQPAAALWFGREWEARGKKLADDYRYDSFNNTQWLTVPRSKKLLPLLKRLIKPTDLTDALPCDRSQRTAGVKFFAE